MDVLLETAATQFDGVVYCAKDGASRYNGHALLSLDVLIRAIAKYFDNHDGPDIRGMVYEVVVHNGDRFESNHTLLRFREEGTQEDIIVNAYSSPDRGANFRCQYHVAENTNLAGAA